MKVTPLNKNFGKHAPGDVFELPDRTAKVLIKIGKVSESTAGAQTYQTRMMQAEAPVIAPIQRSEPAAFQPPTVETDTQGAAWDERLHTSTRLKNADGTWRKRPGAKPAESVEE